MSDESATPADCKYVCCSHFLTDNLCFKTQWEDAPPLAQYVLNCIGSTRCISTFSSAIAGILAGAGVMCSRNTSDSSIYGS